MDRTTLSFKLKMYIYLSTQMMFISTILPVVIFPLLPIDFSHSGWRLIGHDFTEKVYKYLSRYKKSCIH